MEQVKAEDKVKEHAALEQKEEGPALTKSWPATRVVPFPRFQLPSLGTIQLAI
jgi:hypothetical protein